MERCVIAAETVSADAGLQCEPLSEDNMADFAVLFYDGFSAKFGSVKSLPVPRLKAVLALMLQRGMSDPHDRHYLIRQNGRPVAVFGITYGTKHPQPEAPRPVSWWPLLRAAGPLNLLRLIRLFQMFVHIPAADILYISYLCVDETVRGAGIGNRVLDIIHQMARETPGVSRISLYVAENNHRARALYLRRGYTDEKYETSRATQRYMDIYGWHYMIFDDIH